MKLNSMTAWSLAATLLVASAGSYAQAQKKMQEQKSTAQTPADRSARALLRALRQVQSKGRLELRAISEQGIIKLTPKGLCPPPVLDTFGKRLTAKQVADSRRALKKQAEELIRQRGLDKGEPPEPPIVITNIC